MDTKNGILMKKYEMGRLLGQGTFAKVFYARSVQTGQGVAIKVIDKEKIMKVGIIDQIKREISIMRLVRHPNIIQLYEVMATKTKIYFVLEYAKGGELFHKVSKGRLKEDLARKYFQQLINAVDFCHSRGVYHRDLKPENILLDDAEDLKVSDFGLSALAESRREDGLLHTTCGTPAYVAPEVINRKGYDGAKADIWSCGVILFVLLSGYLPFHDSNLMEMYRKIGKGEFKCPSWFPIEVKRLLFRMLDPNPNTRISISRVKENPWFNRGLASKLKVHNRPPSSSSAGTDAASSSSSSTASSKYGNGNAVASEKRDEAPRLSSMNAFDIISMSAGFDLSRLFEEPRGKKEARFISWKPASVIISKMEDVAERAKLKASKRDAGVLKLEGSSEGRKGVVTLDAEIFELTPACHLVEMKKTGGDSLEYLKVVKDEIRPGLKDIVWVWQDDEEEDVHREAISSTQRQRPEETPPQEQQSKQHQYSSTQQLVIQEILP